MGLFDKKYCDICGDKIGLLGNRKLSDGNMCKECAAKLSPWFSERRSSTIEEIREQLAYREANQEAVSRFTVTRSIGDYTKLLIDDNAKKFTVGHGSNPLDRNPDILDFEQAVSCDLRIDSHRTEKKHTENDRQVSYDPPRYEYSYTLYATIHVSGNPWFDEMKINISNGSVSTGEQNMDGAASSANWTMRGLQKGLGMNQTEKYHRYLNMGNEMKQAIDEMRMQTSIASQVQGMAAASANMAAAMASAVPPAVSAGTPAAAEAAAAAPGSVPAPQQGAAPRKGKWFCPNCGMPNEGKFCPACGTKNPFL